MKIALSVDSKTEQAMVDSRFGRAQYFMLYDTDKNSMDFLDNTQNLNAAQGAGIQSAQNVAASGAQALLCGHTGPKAFQVLNSAGISVYYCKTPCSAVDAIKAYTDGALQKAETPDVDSHWV